MYTVENGKFVFRDENGDIALESAEVAVVYAKIDAKISGITHGTPEAMQAWLVVQAGTADAYPMSIFVFPSGTDVDTINMAITSGEFLGTLI
jgi:hypothetical protein